jgi:hypothetical protein
LFFFFYSLISITENINKRSKQAYIQMEYLKLTKNKRVTAPLLFISVLQTQNEIKLHIFLFSSNFVALLAVYFIER